MKLSILAFATFFALGLTSCKKDYTCSCDKIRTANDGSKTSSSDGNYTFRDSEARATSKCNDQEGSGTDLTGDYSRECQIN